MTAQDVAQLLELVSRATGYSVLKMTQTEIKTFIADKADLQDPAILAPLDRILKLGTVVEVPYQLTKISFDISDYVDPAPPPSLPAEPELLPVSEPEAESGSATW